MENKPKGPRGGVKHQPGRGHDRKSGPSKKRKIARKTARKRKQMEEEARKQWEEWDRIPEEARKLLGPQAMPKLPRPNHDTKTDTLIPPAQKWRKIDDVYHKLLYWYYDRQNLQKARPVARRLERLLSEVTSDQPTILSESAWSLVLECKGDLLGAIKHRENEIRLMKRLLQIASNAPDSKAILKHYDYSDLSDRLDLLAILYHDAGNLEQALKILRQSQLLCEKQGIPFDGKNLLDDYLNEKDSISRQSHKNSQKKAV